jgi:hypothetical protein
LRKLGEIYDPQKERVRMSWMDILKHTLSENMKDKIDDVIEDGEEIRVTSIIDRLKSGNVFYIPTTSQLNWYMSRSGKYDRSRENVRGEIITTYRRI